MASAVSRIDGFDRLALAIVRGRAPRERVGFRRIVGGKQARAEIAAPDTPARIDARSEDKSEMIGGERRHGRCQPRERRKTGPLQTLQLAQTLADESAVDPQKRHDIGNCRKRDDVELVEQIGFVLPVAANQPCSRRRRCTATRKMNVEPGRADIGDAGAIVRTVRIDMREGRRICSTA